MAEHDKHSSGVDAVTNMQPSQGRRRLVKGALLATPAVMTLMSGRLASAASATLCQPPVNLVPGGNYVDSQGLPLIWNNDNPPKLGYYKGPGETNFIETPPAATSSCWTSLGRI